MEPMMSPNPKPRLLHHNPRNRAGFSMLEVLIALVVLSIGLLGLAGLQAYGMKANHGAYMRSQASLLSYEILDSIRANRNAAIDGDYDITLNQNQLGGTGQAASDVNSWRDDLDETLPAGRGSISVDPQNVITIVIEWDESRIVHQEEDAAPGAAPAMVQMQTRTRL